MEEPVATSWEMFIFVPVALVKYRPVVVAVEMVAVETEAFQYRVRLAVRSPPPKRLEPADMVTELVALLAKFSQSAEVKNPLVLPEEVARVKVMVLAFPEIVRPERLEEVARV